VSLFSGNAHPSSPPSRPPSPVPRALLPSPKIPRNRDSAALGPFSRGDGGGEGSGGEDTGGRSKRRDATPRRVAISTTPVDKGFGKGRGV
jgi:hypothetical protein